MLYQGNEVSRSGETPEPTVIVRMIESGSDNTFSEVSSSLIVKHFR